MRRLLLLGLLVGLAACELPAKQALAPLPETPDNIASAPARVNGNLGTPQPSPRALTSHGTDSPISMPTQSAAASGGDISLDFADTDLRQVVAEVLGNILKVNYTIDPAVHGSATFRTVTPLSRAQVIPTLQALLSQNGATLVQSDGMWRVLPAGAAKAPTLAGSADGAGTAMVPLRFVAAQDLANSLQPFAGNDVKITVDPGRNVLLVSGEPSVRQTVLNLIEAFDTDVLAGQSYALLPVENDDAQEFASALQNALQSQSNGALASLVRVVPMARANAVLVVSKEPGYIEDARRIYSLVETARADRARSWHVYYLQDSRSNDVAYVLQQAFTPGHVTAKPGGPGSIAPGNTSQQVAGGATGAQAGGGPTAGAAGTSGGAADGMSMGGGGSGTGAMGMGGTGMGAGGMSSPASASRGANGMPNSQDQSANPDGSNPLLGPLDQSGKESEANALRIIPDAQNNSILIYATPREEKSVEAMLRKIDIIPLQVRIDATIAEVTLNDQLQYGTQFFFKSGGVNGALSFASQALTNPALATLNTQFPGFFLGGSGSGGAPFAISALQAVTKVNVLSSPQLLVLDNQPARLQVGSLVPYLTQSEQSTVTAGAPVINSINYRQTGVIMDVLPRVNNGGLVTLDIAQEVSDVAPGGPTTPGIQSPTFLQRNVTSRVVVQDGQTIGLAGLIRDNVQRGNQGIPWLKDVPLLGLLAGQQTNSRDRTELLVLITPHVIHDQRDAKALTADLREELKDAALVPQESKSLTPSGSADPGEALRRKLHLQR
jgi:general secretion pathway protein D